MSNGLKSTYIIKTHDLFRCSLTCESGRSNGNSCIALRDSVKKKFLEFIIIAIPLSLFKF